MSALFSLTPEADLPILCAHRGHKEPPLKLFGVCPFESKSFWTDWPAGWLFIPIPDSPKQRFDFSNLGLMSSLTQSTVHVGWGCERTRCWGTCSCGEENSHVEKAGIVSVDTPKLPGIVAKIVLVCSARQSLQAKVLLTRVAHAGEAFLT